VKPGTLERQKKGQEARGISSELTVRLARRS
jgi:hypothetical protein